MKTISYAITCWNEIDELTTLLNFLQLHIRKEDEIVIQYDESSVTSEVMEYLNLMNSMHKNHIVVGFPLNKDFASFKNNLKSHCTKDYIFQVDADEIPHEYLVEYLGEVLETNPVDIVFVPRVNTVEGLTDEHIKKWGWKVDEKGWVNFPDYQTRIYRNTVDGLTDEHIQKWGWKVDEKGWVNFPDYQTRIYRNTEDVTWMNKVHERITGYDTFSNFPAEEMWSLYHPKKIDRQETQNKFYETI